MTERVSEELTREERMVVLERDETGKPIIWCDPEIADLVAALNAGGVTSVASCSGHGVRPGFIALADGRWLIIANDEERHAIDKAFPIDINGEPTAQSLRSRSSGVKVKGLEWRKSNVAARWVADHPWGSYEIVCNTRDVEYWSPQLGGVGVYWKALEEAKAAAQADYERRALSALEPAEPVEGEADYWAVWSATGTHIGTWEDESDARSALAEYEGRTPRMKGSIRALYASPLPEQRVTDDMVERIKRIETQLDWMDPAFPARFETDSWDKMKADIRALTAALTKGGH